MIGNDIIDLRVLHQHPRSDQLRFQRKILSDSELDWLQFSENPALDIWKLWALKESAYKCCFQRTHRRAFAPKEFICRWDLPLGADHWQATVATPIGLLHSEIYKTKDYFHALCSDKRDRLAAAQVHLFFLPEPDARGQSYYLRKKALSQVAQKMNCPAGELEWDDTAGHPRIRRGGLLLPASISMSHHGRWGAMAFQGVE